MTTPSTYLIFHKAQILVGKHKLYNMWFVVAVISEDYWRYLILRLTSVCECILVVRSSTNMWICASIVCVLCMSQKIGRPYMQLHIVEQRS